ncbi:MAG: hypothetical protein ACREIP_07325 [Alphaproteobacteria bacterium]
MAARKRARRRRAGAAIALGLGVFAGLFLFAVGASVLWTLLTGLGVFGVTWGTGLLVGGGAAGTDLDEGTGIGLSGDGDLGDLG